MMADKIVVRHDDADRLQRLLDTSGKLRDAGTMAALREELDRAEIVDAGSVPADVVTMGATVRFVDEDSGQEQVATLTWPADADPVRARISILAPIGSALLGLRIGQSIAWPMPNGQTRRFRVTGVE